MFQTAQGRIRALACQTQQMNYANGGGALNGGIDQPIGRMRRGAPPNGALDSAPQQF